VCSLIFWLLIDVETVSIIAVQLLEKKSLCQQDPDQDEADEAPEDQAEYDTVLISSAGDIVSALANALGADFAQAFDKFFPLIAKYYVRMLLFSRFDVPV
jgi:importin-4